MRSIREARGSTMGVRTGTAWSVAGGRAGRGVRGRRGVTFIWMTFLLVALLAFATLAIDWGYVRYAEQQIQTAADAAALAGAYDLPLGREAVENAAVDIAAQNQAGGQGVLLDRNPDNRPNGDVVVGTFNRKTGAFVPGGTRPNAVKVVVRKTKGSRNGPVTLLVARMFGVESVQRVRSAIAVGEHRTGIVLLRTDGDGLKHNGTGTTRVDGSIFINSPTPTALTLAGTGNLAAASFEVVGNVFRPGVGVLVGDAHEGVNPVPDPLAALAEPVLSEHVVRTVQKKSLADGVYVLEPGRYQGGIEFSGTGHMTLNPGVYIVEGGGFKVTGRGTLVAEGVMVYSTGTNDTTVAADEVFVSGDAHVTWTAPAGGPYAGIAIFQNRDVSARGVRLAGTGQTTIAGTVYAKSAEVQLSGTSETDVLAAGLVAGSLGVAGDSAFTVAGPVWSARRTRLVR